MLRELRLLNRHQAHTSLVFLGSTSHPCLMHCGLFLALSRLGMMWRERSWSKALASCCSCGNGRPMFQNPLLNALILSLIFVLHFLCQSCQVNAWGRLWQESRGLRGVSLHNCSETWAQPSQGGQDLLQSYSILHFILHDKCFACRILQTTYEKQSKSLCEFRAEDVSGWECTVNQKSTVLD